MTILKDAEDMAERASIVKNEEFRRHMKHVLRACDEEREELDILDEHEAQLMERITLLEDELIEIEMNLQEKLTDSVN